MSITCFSIPGWRQRQQEGEREGEGAAEGVQAAARDETAPEADADAVRIRCHFHLLHQSADRGILQNHTTFYVRHSEMLQLLQGDPGGLGPELG